VIDVLRFPAPGPWITRDLKLCVLASDYDALAAETATKDRRIAQLEAALTKSADTFADLKMTMQLQTRPILEKVCAIAEKAARQALTAPPPP
jgi:hypothetical protein